MILADFLEFSSCSCATLRMIDIVYVVTFSAHFFFNLLLTILPKIVHAALACVMCNVAYD